METFENQQLNKCKSFTGDGKTFTDEGKPFTGDGNTVINNKATVNVASISINQIFLEGRGRYNGEFVAAFAEPMKAIAQCLEFHESELRLLLYLLGSMTKQQGFGGVTLKDVQADLRMSESTARRAIQSLIKANIVCKKMDAGTNIYRMSDKLLNPRVAVYGNTKKVNKKDMPPLLCPANGAVLIPSNYMRTPLEWSGATWDLETGEIH